MVHATSSFKLMSSDTLMVVMDSRNHAVRSVQSVPCELHPGLFSKFTHFFIGGRFSMKPSQGGWHLGTFGLRQLLKWQWQCQQHLNIAKVALAAPLMGAIIWTLSNQSMSNRAMHCHKSATAPRWGYILNDTTNIAVAVFWFIVFLVHGTQSGSPSHLVVSWENLITCS